MARDNRKGDDGWISWAIIVGLFVIGLEPLGLVLLLIKIFGNDNKPRQTRMPPPRPSVEARGEIVQPAGDQPLQGSGAQTAGRPVRRPVNGQVQQPAAGPARQPAGRAREAARRALKSPVPKKSNARLLKAGGIALLVFGLMSSGSALSDTLWALGERDFTAHLSWLLPELLQSLAMMGGGGVMLGAGISMDRGLQRYTKYLSVMGDRDDMPVEELARTLGYPERRVEKDLQKMIDKGYFGGKAYLNVEVGRLFRSEEAAERYRRRYAAVGTAEPPREVDQGYSGMLRNIRRANDAIADPVLSAKIDRLEEIAAKIFQAVEEEPQKQKKIDTFLNYYLPTTQKLLDAYVEFQSAGVEGENLRQAKQRIETTMDTIVKGFEHQLDELYQTDVLDVDSDIRVLETMLRWDTASAARDFGPAAPPEGEKQVEKPEDTEAR